MRLTPGLDILTRLLNPLQIERLQGPNCSRRMTGQQIKGLAQINAAIPQWKMFVSVTTIVMQVALNTVPAQH